MILSLLFFEKRGGRWHGPLVPSLQTSQGKAVSNSVETTWSGHFTWCSRHSLHFNRFSLVLRYFMEIKTVTPL